jgi:hypothetical protein
LEENPTTLLGGGDGTLVSLHYSKLEREAAVLRRLQVVSAAQSSGRQMLAVGE